MANLSRAMKYILGRQIGIKYDFYPGVLLNLLGEIGYTHEKNKNNVV